MKIKINRDDLLVPLQAVHNVVERRQSLPILANLLVTAEPDRLVFTATDMEVETVIALSCSVPETMATTVPARKLFDIVRALPSGAEMELHLGDKQASLRAGRSRFTLSTLPASEFPNIGEFEPQLRLGTEVGALRSLLDSTQFAMAHNDVRYYLNGLLLEFSTGRLRSVATDGHRLALSEQPIELELELPRQVIVPRKGVSELLRLLEAGGEAVELLVSENHLQARTERQHVTTKLIDGKYPDYERVLPPHGDKTVVANREMLRQGLARTSILSNEKFRGIRLTLGPDTLTALAHNPEQEEAEEVIEVEYQGPELEIGFNATYLLDVLGTVNTDAVELVFSDPGSSCLIRPAGDASTRYVIMPLRL